MAKKKHLINREISWLQFNARVLQEAADPRVPLIERIRFLGIFSNNLDEFFRVRVATVKRLIDLNQPAGDVEQGVNPKKLLVQIQKTVVEQQRRFEEIFSQLIQELRKKQIFLINEKMLTEEQGDFVPRYFRTKVSPALVPIFINKNRPFPELKGKSIYLGVKLWKKGAEEEISYALIEVPTKTVSRFLVLPRDGRKKYVILLDDVIRYCLPEVFKMFEFDMIEARTLKITRDAELDIDQDIAMGYLEKVANSVKARRKGNPVRFVYDKKMPKDLLDVIRERMNLDEGDNLIPGGRYHNFKDFMGFPNVGTSRLEYNPITPLAHKALINARSIFEVVRKQELLLHYPYHSFSHVIDFIREAAIDPTVTTIKVTLYRLASNSMVVNSLIVAAKNGKNVIAVVELQARFDEEANIYWSKRMQEEGINVIYGVPGLKVHSKLILVTRLEEEGKVRYANIGTGNYNEKTARIYSDTGFFTSDPAITGEVNNVFKFYQNNFSVFQYKHLIVSPHYTRKVYLQHIQREIENAQAGKEASIFLKMNSLVDKGMINKLYEASKAGVKIRMIVRGICSLVPGVKGLSENIKVISIVDKFLEHSRIYCFHNDGNRNIYISSADWMTRNLDYRVEVSCPIYDAKLQEELLNFMEIQWADNVKARKIEEGSVNEYRKSKGPKRRAQFEFYDYLAKKHPPLTDLD
jgi:polyphosphate kinase